MVAVPAALKVTFPLELTVATLVFELLQEGFSTFLEGVRRALIFVVSPDQPCFVEVDSLIFFIALLKFLAYGKGRDIEVFTTALPYFFALIRLDFVIATILAFEDVTV